MVDRRMFLKTSVAAAVAASVPGQLWIREAFGTPLAANLSDPALQPKFVEPVPDALNPAFKFRTSMGRFSRTKVAVGQNVQFTGLVGADGETPVPTTVWGYGNPQDFYSWPGRTLEVMSGVPVEVKWENRLADDLGVPLPLPVTSFGRPVVDTSLHWAYSLHGYEGYSLGTNGFPIVPHVHGGHSDFQFDGNPEFFFSPGWQIRGPQWLEKKFVYRNDQPAGTVWYHDHALGITRLNVYAGMAGFYIIRDNDDTGRVGNNLDLPAWPYEAALAIQDKMFHADGSLFYPTYPGDPFYDDFITGEGAELPPQIFPGGGPTALAEFFGDHMVVNGKIWPRMNVEPRNYRLRLLNGCDSRFLVVQFWEVPAGATDFSNKIEGPMEFTVIGGDQGLNARPTTTDTLVMETGSRYDVIFDFKNVTPGNRVIMKNIGGDSPFGFAFGDDLDADDLFPDRQTDRIMAFDVVLPLDAAVADVAPTGDDAFTTYVAARRESFPETYDPPSEPDRVRRVALFEGTDEYGRLQPLLGTAEPATDCNGNAIDWPNTPEHIDAGLVGQMEGAIAWHDPTTENPALGDTEEWLIANVTGDAHPIHLHLVHFEVVDRRKIIWDSRTNEDDRVLGGIDPDDDNDMDGTYLVEQPVVQHNGELGSGFKVVNLTIDEVASIDPGHMYVDADSPKDTVAALPGQVTRIRATFDKPGRYVWHCHILSHEDHEMMRVLHVGPGA
jgi:FtsP/CotA-like multicopper oxidase with cupredoxin domain